MENELNSIYSTISALYAEFEENHLKFTVKGNKAAGARARKAAGSIKSLITSYRKASVETSKVEEATA